MTPADEALVRRLATELRTARGLLPAAEARAASVKTWQSKAPSPSMAVHDLLCRVDDAMVALLPLLAGHSMFLARVHELDPSVTSRPTTAVLEELRATSKSYFDHQHRDF